MELDEQPHTDKSSLGGKTKCNGKGEIIERGCNEN